MNDPKLQLAASTAQEEDNDDDVGTCSICLVAFSMGQANHVPWLLQCGHSFCTMCLAHLHLNATTNPAPTPTATKSNSNSNSKAKLEEEATGLQCPKCHTVMPVCLVNGEATAAVGMKGLPCNFDLINLLSSSAVAL